MRQRVAALCVFVLFFTGCDLLDGEKSPQAQQAPANHQGASVDAMVLKQERLPLNFSYTARLASPQSVEILPKVSATIMAQKFKAGSFVKKGDVLFELDSDMYEANAHSARALASSARAEFKRIEGLFNKQASSQKELDAARASKDSSEAALKIAELNLSYTKVKAPFSGVLSDRLSDVGSFASANLTPLVRLSKMDKIEAIFYISDAEAIKAANELRAKTWSDSDLSAKLNVGDKSYLGQIKFIDNQIDTATGTIMVKAVFDNPSLELVPGEIGRIQLEGLVQKDGFKIPQVAILQDGNSPYILLAKDGKIAKQNIKIDYQTPEYAIITQGAKQGDVLILNNFRKIRPGMPVNPNIKE